MDYIKLPGTMGHSGGKLIYSNNPEAINKYHIGYPLRNAGKYIPSAQPFPKEKS